MSYQDLLVEIGCEELPPKNLKKLAMAFAETLKKSLNDKMLQFKSIKSYATPRRLALIVSDLALSQSDQFVLKRGPTKQASFDSQGNPTKAALGFADSCGVNIKDLTLQETAKGAWLVFEQKEIGKPTSELMPSILKESLDALPITKRMRWGNLDDTFVRPIHWIVLLFGNSTIQINLFGVTSSHKTYGHRFHHREAIPLSSPKEYEEILFKTGKVITDIEKRKENIRAQIQTLTAQHHCQAILEEALLEEVTGLVEWPVALMGQFNPDFLNLPKEALISSLQIHQKCFPVIDHQGKLLPKFIVVSNIESIDPLSVIHGNESVVGARLADAAFLYDVDKKTPLHHHENHLKNVVFQAGLGSLFDKSQRMAALAKILAASTKADAKQAERAAHLSKTDLLTQMVTEFPELQGIMGHYYALQAGEPEPIAIALEEHYHPRFALDSLPTTPLGCVLALADRIDSLVGIFGLGKRPTGDKDPFALRRQALGVIRIIVEKEWDLDLQLLFHASKETYGSLLKTNDTIEALLEFSFERFRAWYQEQNIPARVFDAVLAKLPTKPYDFHCRIQAVHAFQTLPEAISLAAANKRVQNILTKSEIPLPTDANFDLCLFKEPAEKALADVVSTKHKEITPLIKASRYKEALKTLADLKDPVDRFFTEVMIMVEDEKLKNNRIKLLNHLRSLFLEIADISLL